MKKFFLLFLLALSVQQLAAQEVFPVKGVFKQATIKCGGLMMTAPQLVYRNHNDKYSLFVFWGNDSPLGKLFTWRVDEAPNAEDPLHSKFKVVNPDSLVFTWYNHYQQFWNFPANSWVDEEWTRVKDDAYLDRLSDALANHNAKAAKGKLTGTWRLAAVKTPDKTGETLHKPIVTYKIYGEQYCVMIQGSIYNVEEGQAAALRPYQMESNGKVVEANTECHVTFDSATKITVEYTDQKDGRCIETWVRYALPEPVSSLFSSFK